MAGLSLRKQDWQRLSVPLIPVEIELMPSSSLSTPIFGPNLSGRYFFSPVSPLNSTLSCGIATPCAECRRDKISLFSALLLHGASIAHNTTINFPWIVFYVHVEKVIVFFVFRKPLA
jgi:hypothetical protein